MTKNVSIKRHHMPIDVGAHNTHKHTHSTIYYRSGRMTHADPPSHISQCNHATCTNNPCARDDTSSKQTKQTRARARALIRENFHKSRSPTRGATTCRTCDVDRLGNHKPRSETECNTFLVRGTQKPYREMLIESKGPAL